jgi:hypothetical protein
MHQQFDIPAGRDEALPELPLPELVAPLALPLPLPEVDAEPPAPELPPLPEEVDPAPLEPEPVVPAVRLFTELVA